MNQTPEDSINLIRKGDQKAFELLFNEFYARLCGYSVLITHDKDASMEIVQDFFVKLWENRNALEIKSVRSYFFRSVHNNSIKYMNKKVLLESISDESDVQYGFSNPGDFELKEKLEQSLGELPPKCREIFILSRVDKLRHNEIAEKLGISSKTVEVQIRKASIILKKKLKEFYLLILFLFFI